MPCFRTEGAQSVISPSISLSKAFETPYAESSVIKDLPRLASRVSINSKLLNHMATSIQPPADSLESPGDSAPPGSAVVQVLSALTSILYPEDEAAAAVCAAATSEYDSTIAGGGDAQGACLELLRQLGGDTSRVVRAVKLVHQGVVLYATSKLREVVAPCDVASKDVRTANGWLIDIDIYENFRVKHVRREQSLDLWGDATDHFEFEYEISATLDRDLTTVHTTWLRVNDVKLAETMDPARRQGLIAALGSGGRILA